MSDSRPASLSERPSWERHDNPKWLWSICLDGDTKQPVAQGEMEDTGLNVLDMIVRRVPEVVYQAAEEPFTLTIELTTVPF